MARWPCLTTPGRERLTTCPLFSPQTAEDIAAEDAEFEALLAQMYQREKAGLCGACGADATFEVVGSCKYARPCGHRLGHVGESDK